MWRRVKSRRNGVKAVKRFQDPKQVILPRRTHLLRKVGDRRRKRRLVRPVRRRRLGNPTTRGGGSNVPQPKGAGGQPQTANYPQFSDFGAASSSFGFGLAQDGSQAPAGGAAQAPPAAEGATSAWGTPNQQQQAGSASQPSSQTPSSQQGGQKTVPKPQQQPQQQTGGQKPQPRNHQQQQYRQQMNYIGNQQYNNYNQQNQYQHNQFDQNKMQPYGVDPMSAIGGMNMNQGSFSNAPGGNIGTSTTTHRVGHGGFQQSERKHSVQQLQLRHGAIPAGAYNQGSANMYGEYYASKRSNMEASQTRTDRMRWVATRLKTTTMYF